MIDNLAPVSYFCIMERYLKKLKPYMQKYLAERYSPEDAKARWDKIVDLDEQWLKEDGDLGGRTNAMSSFMMLCYAMCAFYKALDRNFTREDFNTFAKESMADTFNFIGHFDMNKLEQHKMLMKLAYKLMALYKKKADRKRGGTWGNTWRLRINPNGEAVGIAYILDTCPLYEFAQKHDYLDFMPNFCAMDPYVASRFHAKLIRHNILSDGDPHCDYWYVGDKSQAALNDIGSK